MKEARSAAVELERVGGRRRTLERDECRGRVVHDGRRGEAAAAGAAIAAFNLDIKISYVSLFG
jgi:hypothetical protein